MDKNEYSTIERKKILVEVLESIYGAFQRLINATDDKESRDKIQTKADVIEKEVIEELVSLTS